MAVAVVPTAIVMGVKIGHSSPKGDGALEPSAAMVRQDPVGQGDAADSAAPKTSGSAQPGAGSGNGAGNRSGGASRKPVPGPALRSFTRVTDVKLSGGSRNYQWLTETATFRTWPTFAMSAVGHRQIMKDGVLTKVTQKVVVSGSTLSGYDGEKWTKSKLTSKQLATLRNGSDPRQLTYVIRSVPGVTATGPNASGSSHYLAQAVLGAVYTLLPKDVASRARAVLPDSTAVGLDLWADAKSGRPSWVGLNAAVPGTNLTGSMTFSSYG